MKWGLHTSSVADWEKSGQLNSWQRLAAWSNGVLTPANLASVVGGVVALYGLWVILEGHNLEGLVLLGIGRIADLADGIIAEYTKTKSPLGEIVDATVDKIVITSTLIVVGAMELVPWIIIAVVAFQNVANVIISVVAKLRDKTLHPSRLGKISAAFSWVTIILYPLADLLQDDIPSWTGKFLIGVSILSFAVYTIMGLRASLSYAHVIYKKPARKLYSLFK